MYNGTGETVIDGFRHDGNLWIRKAIHRYMRYGFMGMVDPNVAALASPII